MAHRIIGGWPEEPVSPNFSFSSLAVGVGRRLLYLRCEAWPWHDSIDRRHATRPDRSGVTDGEASDGLGVGSTAQGDGSATRLDKFGASPETEGGERLIRTVDVERNFDMLPCLPMKVLIALLN